MTPERRPELSVGAIVIHDGALLLIQRGREPALGLWSVPGGRVEGGETLAQAVEREVAEETGLDVRCGEYVGMVERIGGGYHYVIVDYLATVVGPTTLTPGDDAANAAWVPLDQVPTIDLVAGMLPFLQQHQLL